MREMERLQASRFEALSFCQGFREEEDCHCVCVVEELLSVSSVFLLLFLSKQLQL